MTLEDKIDKISENVSYMRGQWDTVIPRIQEDIDVHETSINDIKTKQDNMAGKSSIIGGIIGAVGGIILTVISGKIRF